MIYNFNELQIIIKEFIKDYENKRTNYTLNYLYNTFMNDYKNDINIKKKKDTIFCLIGIEYINMKIS